MKAVGRLHLPISGIPIGHMSSTADEFDQSFVAKKSMPNEATPPDSPKPESLKPSAAPEIRNPKREVKEAERGRADWFRYYAGFSTGFVEDTINQLDLAPNSLLLDPWLGAGTTAQVTVANGHKFRGYDLNPAMLFVARARLIATESTDDLSARAKNICHFFERTDPTTFGPNPIAHDPLEQWLQPASARAFRYLERTIANEFSNDLPISDEPIWASAGKIQPLSAFFYVALFRTLRHFISKFQSSNPTWVKVSKGKRRIQLSVERIYNRFIREMAHLESALISEPKSMPSIEQSKYIIEQASSTTLPLLSNSIDAVVSSPPYCTRIDYVRATLPELAVIGFPNGAPHQTTTRPDDWNADDLKTIQ